MNFLPVKYRYNTVTSYNAYTIINKYMLLQVQALQSLGPVLRDLQFASSAVPSVGNMTSNSTVQQAFQMRRLLCGDTLQAQTNVLNTASSTFGNAAASGDSSSSSGSSSSSSSSSSSQSSKRELLKSFSPHINIVLYAVIRGGLGS